MKLNTYVSAALLMCLGLLLSPNLASAKTPGVMVATSPDGSVKITLRDKPCDEKVAKLIENKNVLAKSQAAKVVIGDVPFEACWMVVPKMGAIAIIMEDSSEGLVPMEVFEPAEEI